MRYCDDLKAPCWTPVMASERAETGRNARLVTSALAKALLLAAEGGRWDIAAKIATELEARRRERFSGRNGAREALKR